MLLLRKATPRAACREDALRAWVDCAALVFAAGYTCLVSRARRSAKRCAADPGPRGHKRWVPGLQRTSALRAPLRCARDTRPVGLLGSRPPPHHSPPREQPMTQHRTETRDGMTIEWDAPIAMDDGVVLRCDVFRPLAAGRHPVILSYGPYAKGLSFQEGYRHAWLRVVKACPEIEQGSSNKYQHWELLDPERWVPDGYALVRVDSRGAGRSPGFVDVWSAREAKDIAICVDWAGTQPWSNGKVGLNGISYYAQNQWQTAALAPKHLAAICLWEGAADLYRDMAHHAGIFNRGFAQDWSKAQVYSVQNGRGTRGFKSRMNGDWVSGPATVPDEELRQNRREFYQG